VRSKQHYVPKFNLRTKQENVKLHIKVINVVNIAIDNDYKLSSLGGDVLTPNSSFNQEDSLKEMSSLIDDLSRPLRFRMLSRYMMFLLRMTWLTYLVCLFQILFSKFNVIDENLSQNKHENVNIVKYNFPWLLSLSMF